MYTPNTLFLNLFFMDNNEPVDVVSEEIPATTTPVEDIPYSNLEEVEQDVIEE